jgi:hypothetical protein
MLHEIYTKYNYKHKYHMLPQVTGYPHLSVLVQSWENYKPKEFEDLIVWRIIMEFHPNQTLSCNRKATYAVSYHRIVVECWLSPAVDNLRLDACSKNEETDKPTVTSSHLGQNCLAANGSGPHSRGGFVLLIDFYLHNS